MERPDECDGTTEGIGIGVVDVELVATMVEVEQ